MYFNHSSINHGLIRTNNQSCSTDDWPSSTNDGQSSSNDGLNSTNDGLSSTYNYGSTNAWLLNWLSITYNHGSSNDGLRASQVDHFVCDADFGDTVFASRDVT